MTATIRFYNKKGMLTACLYIMADGMLHSDSWLCSQGWE